MPRGISAATGHSTNWKGGRSISSHGYVLIHRPNHPRAFGNGYVYEHWLVAEDMLGRPLFPDEEVHHDNEVRGDNRPENLIVCGSRYEHRVAHRKPGSKIKRLPGEPNVEVPCACGCGATLLRYDSGGRERRYITGHNLRPAH